MSGNEEEDIKEEDKKEEEPTGDTMKYESTMLKLVQTKVSLLVEEQTWDKVEQEYIMTKIMKWDPDTRDSEQQLINLIKNCNEENMGEMFRQSTPNFDEKFLVKGDIKKKTEGFHAGRCVPGDPEKKSSRKDYISDRCSSKENKSRGARDFPLPDKKELDRLKDEVKKMSSPIRNGLINIKKDVTWQHGKNKASASGTGVLR